MLSNPWGSRPPKRAWTRTAVLLGTLVLLASACGSDSTEVDTDGDAGPASTAEPQLADSGVASLGSTTTVVESEGDKGDEITLDENSSDEEIFRAWQACMVDEGVSELENMAMTDLAGTAELESDPKYVAASQVCDEVISDAFGSFKLDPAMEAELADRSVQLAACGRELLGIDIPDEVLFLDEDDPRMSELVNLETTPEQDAAIEECLQEALGDLFDEDGNLKTSTDDSAGSDTGEDQ